MYELSTGELALQFSRLPWVVVCVVQSWACELAHVASRIFWDCVSSKYEPGSSMQSQWGRQKEKSAACARVGVGKRKSGLPGLLQQQGNYCPGGESPRHSSNRSDPFPDQPSTNPQKSGCCWEIAAPVLTEKIPQVSQVNWNKQLPRYPVFTLWLESYFTPALPTAFCFWSHN